MGDGPLDGLRRALVVGLGRSGTAAIETLVVAGVGVVAVDDDPAATYGGDAQGVIVEAGSDGVSHLDSVDLLIPSPGVPEHADVISRALAADLPVWSEPELGWRLHPHRVVAITGTNGKTSVTELTASMLSASGVDAVACGNIGTPFSVAAREHGPGSVLVAELSSFQLRFCHELRPEVGLLLNLEPDHLDWHGDLAAYGAAKARMWQAQREEDHAVANVDDPAVVDLAQRHAPHELTWFSGSGRHVDIGTDVHGGTLHAHLGVYDGDLLSFGDLPLDAPHHRANVAAAACGALLAGATAVGVREAAQAFHPGRHRLEPVATVAEVAFVDDSKATNVGSARAALRSFTSIVWIAGGLAKGADLSPLADHLEGVRHAVLIGEAAGALADVCTSAGVAVTLADSMEAAVRMAFEAAEPGDTVLLAPACASFDMFDDYADRGDRFAAAARALSPTGERGA